MCLGAVDRVAGPITFLGSCYATVCSQTQLCTPAPKLLTEDGNQAAPFDEDHPLHFAQRTLSHGINENYFTYDCTRL